MNDLRQGTLVRFANEKNGGPVHRVVSVMRDGMIELHDIPGYFAPHLFEVADDIGDIPPMIEPSPTLDERAFILFRAWADKLPDEGDARKHWDEELSMADQGEWRRRVLAYEFLLRRFQK
jgi:hypothetical protein